MLDIETEKIPVTVKNRKDSLGLRTSMNMFALEGRQDSSPPGPSSECAGIETERLG